MGPILGGSVDDWGREVGGDGEAIAPTLTGFGTRRCPGDRSGGTSWRRKA